MDHSYVDIYKKKIPVHRMAFKKKSCAYLTAYTKPRGGDIASKHKNMLTNQKPEKNGKGTLPEMTQQQILLERLIVELFWYIIYPLLLRR